MHISTIKTNNLNSQSFCKKLVATCNVKTRNDNSKECNIYQLDKKKDTRYFLNLGESRNWDENKFLGISNQLMLSPLLSSHIIPYVMEDEKGDCLGYISVLKDEDKGEKASIQYLETCPKHSSNNKERQIKYIGESLLAFVVSLAKNEDVARVCVPTYSSSAKPFYYWKCCFREDKDKKDGLVLDRRNYDKFLDRHNKKVGSEITFIA